MKKLTAIVLILLAAALTGCQSAPQAAGPEATPGALVTPAGYGDITGTRWVLRSMTANGQTTQPTDPGIWLQFDDNYQVSGQATINRYFGAFRINDQGQIQWPAPLGYTRMAGNFNLLRQEIAYFKALPQTDRIRLDDSRLILANEPGTVELVYAPAETE